MAEQNLSVVLGPRAMNAFGDESGQSGKDAYEAQRERMSKEAGSVGLGAAFDKPFVPKLPDGADDHAKSHANTAKSAPQQNKDAKATAKAAADAAKKAAPGKASVPAGKGKGTPPATPKSAGAGKGEKNAPKTTEFSEDDAGRLLTADANIWPKILDAETKRAEGPRLAVVTALLDAGGKAETEIMPVEIKQQLKAMLGLDPTAE